MVRLNELTFAFPEGFRLLNEDEIRELHINETGDENIVMKDDDRHMLVSLSYQKVNPLFLAVLSLKEIVEKNETQTADLMRRFAYHKEAYLNTGKAQGFDYTYEAGGKKMYGASYNIKGKKGLYHIHFYLRDEERDLYERLTEEIMASAQA